MRPLDSKIQGSFLLYNQLSMKQSREARKQGWGVRPIPVFGEFFDFREY
jgi:hypothetical protein